jgi:biopolymer transport protein ExbD
MKCILCVCLAATICVGAALHSAVRQSVAQAQTRAMQKGIRVEMASATNAQAWPQADDNDAWVVAVDSSGRLYLGADSMTQEELKQWMIEHPRRRDQKLYIKADARASYANVEKALDAASDAEFGESVLLVNQRDPSARPGVVVPPKGLEVVVGSHTPSGTVATVAELSLSGQRLPLAKINNDEIPWSALEETLKQHFHKGDDNVVLLKANGRLPFAEVVYAIDNCRAAGATVYLAEPEL